MDPIGAVTSCLKLVHQSLKTASTLQEFSDIQDDYADLREQVEEIDTIIREFRKIPGLFPADLTLTQVSEPLLILQAVRKLKQINDELNAIVIQCAKTSNSERANRRKWIPQRHKIAKLNKKAIEAKSNLQMAVQFQVISLAIILRERDDGFHSEALPAIRYWRQLQLSSPSSIAPESIEELPNPERLEEVKVCHDDVDIKSMQGAANERVTVLSNYQDSTTGLEDDIKEAPSLHLETAIPLHSNGEPGYLGKCRCQCNIKQTHRQTPAWLRPALGSLFVAYTSKLDGVESKCQCSQEVTVNVEYHVPRWLWARSLLLKVVFGNAGLNFALRPARVIPANDTVCVWIDRPNGYHGIRDMLLRYFPDDRDEDGVGLVERAINKSNYAAIEMFLAQWQNLLPKQGLSRGTGMRARSKLESARTSYGQEKNLLSQVLTWVDDMPEQRWTRLHEAAKLGSGIEEALQEDMWAIDECGNASGLAPLHVAIQFGNTKALGELIAAGADIHRSDFFECTPLMAAGLLGRIQCMHHLLKAQCDIDQGQRSGNTALHLAVQYGQSEAVALLLAAGASASRRGWGGHTPLHILADSPKIRNPASQEAIFNLLLAAKGVDLEARDKYGSTPACRALFANNIFFLRHAMKEGASLKFIDSYSQTFLSFAAKHSDLEVLKYLLSMSPSTFLGINHRLCDNSGFTSWDRFLWIFHVSDFYLAGIRRPYYAEKEAFSRLYEIVRDQNIQHDIHILENAIAALKKNDRNSARSQLDLIIRQKTDWGEHDLLGFYRGIYQEIQTKNYTRIIDVLNEEIGYLTDQMNTSPWDIESQWRCDDCVTEFWLQDDDEWETCSSSYDSE